MLKYISVKNTQQLQAVRESGAADVLICGFIPKGLFSGEENFLLSLPDVLRERRIENIKKMLLSAKAVIIHNIDEIGLLREHGYQGDVIGGELLYAYNSEAVRFYRRVFPQMRFIAPAELTDAEMLKLEHSAGIRFIYKVYGRQKLMTTAQYLNGSFRNEKGGGFAAIYDGVNECSEIYSAVPVSMLERPKEWSGRDILLEFTTEGPEEIRNILFSGSTEKYTRGHHYKGID